MQWAIINLEIDEGYTITFKEDKNPIPNHICDHITDKICHILTVEKLCPSDNGEYSDCTLCLSRALEYTRKYNEGVF